LEKKDNPYKKREEAGDDMGNLLAGLRDLVMNENEPKLSCFKYLPKSGLIGCGLHPDLGGGVVTIRGDLTKLTFADRHNHDIDRAIRSKDKTPAAPLYIIGDLVELSLGKFLVLTRTPRVEFVIVQMKERNCDRS
jgi:hypothetical protein